MWFYASNILCDEICSEGLSRECKMLMMSIYHNFQIKWHVIVAKTASYSLNMTDIGFWNMQFDIINMFSPLFIFCYKCYRGFCSLELAVPSTWDLPTWSSPVLSLPALCHIHWPFSNYCSSSFLTKMPTFCNFLLAHIVSAPIKQLLFKRNVNCIKIISLRGVAKIMSIASSSSSNNK